VLLIKCGFIMPQNRPLKMQYSFIVFLTFINNLINVINNGTVVLDVEFFFHFDAPGVLTSSLQRKRILAFIITKQKLKNAHIL